MQQADHQQPQQQQQQQPHLQQQQQQQAQQQNGTYNSSGGDVGTYSQPIGDVAGGKRQPVSGGRFDFEDGGTYCGGWDEGKAHGHGVCTGPKHQGAYAGAWNYGFEVSGSYIWPSGSHYEGQWQNGRRHGHGVEQMGRTVYRGEWSKDGHKGRYGVRESTVSTARYEGTWNLGYQDGYGVETYADGGKYQGQWQEGKRHGYGLRTSAPFGLASHHRRKNMHASMSSLGQENGGKPENRAVERSEEIRGGFVLTAKSDKLPQRRNSLTDKSKKGFLSGLKMRKQRSTGDLEKRGTLASGSIRSTMSTASWLSTASEQSNLTAKSAHTESNASFTMDDEQLDPTVVETYMGEWKKDRRCGYGVAERSDGLKYEGEWYNNKKNGYGVTTFRDGTVEEGKYKNNILITSQKKKHLFLARSRKFRERITASVNSAQRALKMAMQRSDIALSRTITAVSKAEAADRAAEVARQDCELAVQTAREFAPAFKPTVLERFEKLRFRERFKGGPLTSGVGAASTAGAGASPTSVTDYGGGASQASANRMAASQPPQQQQKPQANHLQQSSAFQQPRRTSHTAVQQDPEFPVPSSMYSQQLPVTPQTDLSSLISQPLAAGPSSISAINQMYHQQQQQQAQQQQQPPTALHHQQQQQQPLSNPQTNPAYQFQQQQPPGMPAASGSPMSPQMRSDSNLFRESEASHTLNNMHQHQQLQQQQMQQQQVEQQQLKQQQMQQQQRQQQMQQHPMQQQQMQQQQIQQQQQQQHQMQQQQHQQQMMQQQQHQQHLQQQLQMQQQQQFQPQQQQHLLGGDQQQSPQQTPNHMPPSRRPSQMLPQKAPMLGQTQQQSSIDYFDHYKRPPSRDSSIDRYARAASRMSGGFGSRQASVDRAGLAAGTAANGRATPEPGASTTDGAARPRSGSAFRGSTPQPTTAATTTNGSVPSGRMSRTTTPSMQRRGQTPSASGLTTAAINAPFEDVLMRQRTLGQDIIPSPLQPKRTESLYMPAKPASPMAAAGGGGGGKKMKSVPINVTLQRKKSLPDFQELPRATEAMSREEVSALGSARREAVRRQIETNERLKANPLLYLVSPQVKDWFSRQQLVLLVLFANILLAILFVKMLT